MSERSFRRDRQRRIDAAKRREAFRARRAAAAAAAAGAFALAAPAASSAADFVVNSTGDTGATTCDPNNLAQPCELRDAVNKATANGEADSITFDSSITGDTITLNNGRIVIDDSGHTLNIDGGPTADSIYVSGGYGSMVFDVENTYYTPDNTGLTIAGMTIENGQSYSGGPYDAAGAAGGLFASTGANLTLANTVVTGNTAGGAVLSTYFFAGGGGVTNFGSMTIRDSTFHDNHANTYRPTLSYGGGGGIDNLGRLTISGSLVDHNDSTGMGGGILNGIGKYPTALNVSDTTISNNSAPYGGGIESFNFFAPLLSGRGQITNSTISGNEAVTGGGLDSKYLGGSEHWRVTHSTISDNNGVYGGGLALGSLLVSGSIEFVDSTISGNYAAIIGGGAYLDSGAQKYEDAVQFNNSTIASNEASVDGGGLYLGYLDSTPPPASIPLFSTLVGNNSANGALNDLAEASGSSGAFDLSFSLVRTPGAASITQTPAGSNLLGADPQLGPLGGNGGPTETQLPSVNSPVVDQGSAPGNLTTDQRGGPRTVDTSVANARDGTDIGSVELSSGPPGPAPAPAPAQPATTKKKCKKKKKHSSAQTAKKKCKKKKKK